VTAGLREESTKSKLGKIEYRPDIDGLRAIAVLAVIVFHFSADTLPGGFLGVDVFFVISGFLITKIIAKEIGEGTFTFKTFWIRRIRRLLPAFAVMAIAVCLFCLFFMPYTLAEGAAKQTIASALAVNNIYLLKLTNDYWGQSAESAPLLHTWSLSVEEQFYIVYPVLLWLTFKFSGVAKNAKWLFAGMFASVLFSFYLAKTEPPDAFFLSTSRAWELLIGCIVALQAPRTSSFLAGKWSAAAGLAFIVLSFLSIHEDGFTPTTGSVLAVVGAALMCSSTNGAHLASKILSSTPLVYIGRASYSLYLWHWPPLVIAATYELAWPGAVLRAPALFVGLMAGLISYHFIEPLGRRASFPKVGAPIIYLLTIGLALGIYFNRTPVTKPLATEITVTSAAGQPSVYLIGDSHAEYLEPSLREELALRGMIVKSGVSSGHALSAGSNRKSKSAFASWNKTHKERLAYIESNKPERIVISCRWDRYTNKDEWKETTEVLEQIKALNPNALIVIVGQAPIFGCGEFKPNDWANWVKKIGAPTTEFVRTNEFNSGRAMTAGIAQRMGFVYVDSEAIFIRHARIPSNQESLHTLYADDDHVSHKGGALIARHLVALAIAPNQ
jgi:peptidoglycan/LPS O-acetylase OafA/YrhL